MLLSVVALVVPPTLAEIVAPEMTDTIEETELSDMATSGTCASVRSADVIVPPAVVTLALLQIGKLIELPTARSTVPASEPVQKHSTAVSPVELMKAE